MIHSAEDEQYGKPHPAVFLTAAAKLGAPPRRCLVWEDAPAGVLAAKAASMACIAVPEAGEGHHPAFGLADLVVDSLLEVERRSRAGRPAGGERPVSEHPLEARRHLAVAGDRNEVHAVEGARVPDAGHQIAGRLDAGVAIRLESLHEAGRDVEARDVERCGPWPALATTMTPA